MSLLSMLLLASGAFVNVGLFLAWTEQRPLLLEILFGKGEGAGDWALVSVLWLLHLYAGVFWLTLINLGGAK